MGLGPGGRKAEDRYEVERVGGHWQMKWVCCRSCRDEGLLVRSSECGAKMDVGWTYGETDPVQLCVSQGIPGAVLESDTLSEISVQYCFPSQFLWLVRGSSGVVLATELYKASISHGHVRQPDKQWDKLAIRLFAAAMEAKLCVLLSPRFLLSFNPFTANLSKSPI